MFTISLSHLLNRGIRPGAYEAIAIVQLVATGPGEPSIETVEIVGDGRARCTGGHGQPTIPALASLLQALLPAHGVPAPLRYTVARGLGAVVAPPFASPEEFSRALARFEEGDRHERVRDYLARGARPAGARRAEPAADVVLLRAPAPVPRARAAIRGWLVAAALALSGIAGFATTRAIMPAAPRRPPDPTAARPADAPVATLGILPRDTRTTAAAVTEPHVRPVAVRTGAFSPAFSPDGTALFFQTGGPRDASSSIATAPDSSSPAEDLRIVTVIDDGSRNYHARPSPDGGRIAFDSDRDGERGVYVADRDGSHVHRVSGPGYAALPTWSPDGTRLAYVRAAADHSEVWNLWLQPLDEGPPRQLTAFKEGQTWSGSWFPDGRRIAFSHEDTLTILDIESGRTRRFAAPVRGRLVRTPAVSPDGTKIVFQVSHAGAWLLNVADGTMQCILTDPTAEEFAWAPDGHRIAFHSRRDGAWGVFVLARG
jgi:hypothetical protein